MLVERECMFPASESEKMEDVALAPQREELIKSAGASSGEDVQSLESVIISSTARWRSSAALWRSPKTSSALAALTRSATNRLRVD